MRVLALLLLAALALVITGCQGNDMTKAEMDRAAHSKFDDAARAKMIEGMKKGGEDRQKQEADWAATHQADLARINAERAKYGRPPLAGGQ